MNTLNLLKENNAGYGYCAAWFFRRFLRPVRISTEPSIHKGMGLDWYVLFFAAIFLCVAPEPQGILLLTLMLACHLEIVTFSGLLRYVVTLTCR